MQKIMIAKKYMENLYIQDHSVTKRLRVKNGKKKSNSDLKNKDIEKIHKAKRITRKTAQEESNKDKGNRLEEQIYEVLTKIEQVTVKKQDGYFSKDKERYISTGDGGVNMITVMKEEIKLYID